MPKAVGLHDFTADDEGDLPFSAGDEIEVTDQTEPGEGWWTGRNSQGVVGIFPANHVELVDEGPLLVIENTHAIPELVSPLVEIEYVDKATGGSPEDADRMTEIAYRAHGAPPVPRPYAVSPSCSSC